MNMHMFCVTAAVTLNKGLSCQGKASHLEFKKGLLFTVVTVRPANINRLKKKKKEQKYLLTQDLTLFCTKICTSFYLQRCS